MAAIAGRNAWPNMAKQSSTKSARCLCRSIHVIMCASPSLPIYLINYWILFVYVCIYQSLWIYSSIGKACLTSFCGLAISCDEHDGMLHLSKVKKKIEKVCSGEEQVCYFEGWRYHCFADSKWRLFYTCCLSLPEELVWWFSCGCLSVSISISIVCRVLWHSGLKAKP